MTTSPSQLIDMLISVQTNRVKAINALKTLDAYCKDRAQELQSQGLNQFTPKRIHDEIWKHLAQKASPSTMETLKAAQLLLKGMKVQQDMDT